jgi:iron complex outermembrane receptor protein
MLDGHPLNAADGSFNGALAAPELASALAVSAGPAPRTLALGGALALVSPDAASTARMAAAGGAFGSWRAAVSLPIEGTEVAGWAGAALVRSDGWRRQSGQQRFSAGWRVRSRAGEGRPVIGLGLYAASPRYDVPGPLTLAAAEAGPESISTAAAVDRPRRRTDFVHMACDAAWSWEDGADLNLALGAQRTDDLFHQLRANGVTRARGSDFSAAVSAGRSFGAHHLEAGVFGLRGGRDQERFANVAGEAGAAFAALDWRARTVSAWVEDEWRLGRRLTVTGGLSWFDAARSAAGSPAAVNGSARSHGVAPAFGARWRPFAKAADFTLFADARRAFEAPSMDDLLAVRGAAPALSAAWVPLRAQRSDTAEFGVRGAVGGLRFEVAGYEARWRGELLRMADANGAARGTVNAEAARHRGVESAVRWRVAGGNRPFDIMLAHTWSEARFDDDRVYGENRIAGLPPHVGCLEIASVPEAGGFASARASWIGGRTWVDHANRLAYGGHVLVGVRAGWRSRSGWTVFGAIDNVFDRRTIASSSGVIDIARNPAATALFLPGAPRSWQAGLEWAW